MCVSVCLYSFVYAFVVTFNMPQSHNHLFGSVHGLMGIRLVSNVHVFDTVRVYPDRTRQRQFDDVKHNALVLEHILINRCIQTGRVASKILFNRDTVDLTLALPV